MSVSVWSSPPPSSSPPSFSLLPDETTVNYLARIPRSYYPTLSIVSKSFHSLLSSTELYRERSRVGNTEECLYVCLRDCSSEFPKWFRLWINPYRALPNSSVTKKTTTGQLLVPIPSSNISDSSVAIVGSEIYAIGGQVHGVATSAVRVLDCRSHIWRDGPSMNVAREFASSCVYDGKIYVIGGCERLKEPWGEVFDTKTQTWECLPSPGYEVRKHGIYQIIELEGKIMFESCNKMYVYDANQGKLEWCQNENAKYPESNCVIENVSYSAHNMCEWYDIKDKIWKEVKGLDSLRNKYMQNGGSSTSVVKLVSCGGKLLLMWEGFKLRYPNDVKNIWCAEIVVEKRDGGEIWGNLEWVDVVLTVSKSCYLWDCLVVSV